MIYFLLVSAFCIFVYLCIFKSGCPRKNRPLNFDQIFDFLQTVCARQGLYRTNENTFRLLLIVSIPEILRQMLLVPEALKIALSSSRN